MIYKNMLENNIDNIIQDPDDPGVDLDAVEKAIAGEDGLAAHQDEVDAATDGMIGDPVEEFAMIMYESEYNYNQIMEAIGMAELREASMGRDLVLEGADIKGFFKKIKDFFVNMFTRITEAVQKVLAKLDLQTKSDKKFVSENKDLIIKGYATDWKQEAYKISDLSEVFTNSGKADDAVTFIKGLMDKLRTGVGADVAEEVKNVQKSATDKTIEKTIIKDLFNIEAENIKDFKKKLYNSIFGNNPNEEAKRVELSSKDVDVNSIIEVLSNDKESKTVRATYASIKKSFKKMIDEIKEWENKAKNTENVDNYITGCNLCVKYCKTARSISHTGFSVAIDAANYKRRLYRKLAHEFVKAAGGNNKNNSQNSGENNSAPKNESGSLFDRISVI